MKTAFVSLKAKDEDSATALRASLLNLQQLSREEPGHVAYEVFQSENERLDFYVRESWQDQSAFDTHCATEHLQQFAKDTETWLTQPFSAVMLTLIKD